MLFPEPLIQGTLVKRYKRFIADVNLTDGMQVSAHCANSGSMLGLVDPGTTVWLSKVPEHSSRKLRYTWELCQLPNTLVGVNTSFPNVLAEEAIKSGVIPDLSGYSQIRREVKYGLSSRVDLLLQDQGRPDCYVEVKNVTLSRDGIAEFPDAVTARGLKHLDELENMVKQGFRAVMLYVVQREDCQQFKLACDIDKAYTMRAKEAFNNGVEALCFSCKMTTNSVSIEKQIEMKI